MKNGAFSSAFLPSKSPRSTTPPSPPPRTNESCSARPRPRRARSPPPTAARPSPSGLPSLTDPRTPPDGDKSLHCPGASKGGVSRHRRGRRAGRIVQARRRPAIDAEYPRRLARIPQPGPGPAPGIGNGTVAEGSGDRQPTAPDAEVLPRRVERQPWTENNYRRGISLPADAGRTSPAPSLLEQTRRAAAATLR